VRTINRNSSGVFIGNYLKKYCITNAYIIGSREFLVIDFVLSKRFRIIIS
jgi:hypothetical protein